jgi:hypothetical protein
MRFSGILKVYRSGRSSCCEGEGEVAGRDLAVEEQRLDALGAQGVTSS